MPTKQSNDSPALAPQNEFCKTCGRPTVRAITSQGICLGSCADCKQPFVAYGSPAMFKVPSPALAEPSAPSKGMDSGEPSSALTAPTSHQELVEKARKFVHAMGRKPQSSGPTRAATWMLEYATGDTRMDIYELLVAFVESIERAGAESGVPLEEKK